MGKKSTSDPFNQELGRQLRTAREKKGLTHSEVASQIGHNHSINIGRYENATRTPDYQTLAALGTTYDVEPWSLVKSAQLAAQQVNEIRRDNGKKQEKEK